jgi:hypothetical protein
MFSKRKRTVLSAATLDKLVEYGHVVLDARRTGRPVTDPRFDWTNFLGPIHMAMSTSDKDAIVDELFEAASSAGQRDLATLGAYRVLAEFSHMDDRRYLQLCDASLDYLRSAGLSSNQLTGYEAQRWTETHGDLRLSFDRLFEVSVPSPIEAPPVKQLARGETRMLTLTGPLPGGNAFFAEHRPEGGYIVFLEGPQSVLNHAPGLRLLSWSERVREDQISMGVFDSLPALLRDLGHRLGIPPYWADDDLEPYFPQRRS